MSRVHIGGVLAAAFEALLPGMCPHCDHPLRGFDRGLCGQCWSMMVPRAGDSCARCGIPTDASTDGCLDCARKPPPQKTTVVWGEHAGVLRTAVLELKHRNRDDLAGSLGGRLAATVAAHPWASTIDTVCFVPSHPIRRIRRSWVAAERLAQEVGRRLHRPVAALLQRRGLWRQTGRTRAQRLHLPTHSFSSAPAARGRHLLLVDDVMTTGTTLRRASRALLQAGAQSVSCAVLAHAPDSRRFP